MALGNPWAKTARSQGLRESVCSCCRNESRTTFWDESPLMRGHVFSLTTSGQKLNIHNVVIKS